MKRTLIVDVQWKEHALKLNGLQVGEVRGGFPKDDPLWHGGTHNDFSPAYKTERGARRWVEKQWGIEKEPAP